MWVKGVDWGEGKEGEVREREEIKARLLKGYEELVERMLEEKPADEEILLEEIERMAVEVGERVKQQVAQALSEEAKRGEALCPECGERAPVKGYRHKQVVTVAGEVRLRRAYHYCKRCQKGFFPPG